MMDPRMLRPLPRRGSGVLLLALGALLHAAPSIQAQAASTTGASAATAQGAWAGTHAPARYRAAVDSLRATLARLQSAEAIPGMSVAVIVDGRLVMSEGMGYADLENRVPATPLTRFRIGSVSKSMTAEAVGLLVEQGKLDLDQPVQKYVPDYPRQKWPITTRQVGGHLAGIRHYGAPGEMLSSRHYNDVRSALSIFENDSLLSEPGTRYFYSSNGFNLISAVVEGASGERFLTYMTSHVFDPLGMRSIVADHVDSLIPWRASFYERGENVRLTWSVPLVGAVDGRSLTNAPYVDQSNKWAGGGFLSNSEDLARFGWAHVEGGILKPGTISLLTTSQRTRDGKETGYGIGWFTGVDDAGRRWFGHTGGSVGGRAVLVVYPEQRVVVAVLANLGQAPLTRPFGLELARMFVGAGE